MNIFILHAVRVMFMLNTLYVLIYTHLSTEMTLKCILVYH